MPVYLVHGFRWAREGATGIRVHAVAHNMNECSVEYVQNTNSRNDILTSFRSAFPDLMKHLEGPGRTLEFIEQYDPDDESHLAVVQPHAFVADRVIMIAGGIGAAQALAAQQRSSFPSPTQQPQSKRQSAGQSQASSVRAARGSQDSSKSRPSHAQKASVSQLNTPASVAALSLNVEDVIATGPGLTSQAWEALADLRDKIAEGEKIGWWVVYNGDPERAYPSDSEEDDEYYEQDQGQPAADLAREGVSKPITKGSTSASIPTTITLPTRPQDKQLPQTPGKQPPNKSTSSDSPAIPTKTPTKSRSQTFIPRTSKSVTSPPAKEQQATTSQPGANPGQAEDIPEPAQLKEVSKSSGIRKKFFGRKL